MTAGTESETKTAPFAALVSGKIKPREALIQFAVLVALNVRSRPITARKCDPRARRTFAP